jgi:hypothetical protein
MTHTQKFLLVLLFCAIVTWFTDRTGRMLVVLLLVLFGPGYLLERVLSTTAPSRLFIRPALWLGLSISLIVLLYTWAMAFDLTFTPTLLALLLGACALACSWKIWHTANTAHTAGFTTNRSSLVAGIAFIAILGGTLWTRFSQIRNLALPPWVDSVHHALLIRIAAEQGHAPQSLQPYLPIDYLPYHWGYHTLIAPIVQISGLDLAQTMLLSGQVLNALHILTCAALAALLWRHPFAGVVAALIVGVISIMPAYYLSWGRYTQLTGLLILPALAICWHSMLHTPTRANWLHVSILLSGQAITHARILIFALTLLAILTVIWAIREPWPVIRSRLLPAVLAGGLALVLAVPWLATLAVHALQPAEELPRSLTLRGGPGYNALNEALLWTNNNRLLAALALLGGFWGVWRRALAANMMLCWTGALVVLANPWLLTYLLPGLGCLLGLWAIRQQQWLWLPIAALLILANPWFMTIPYITLVTNEVLIITLFVPMSVLIGGGAHLLYTWLVYRIVPPPYRSLAAGAALAVLALILAWGMHNMRDVVNLKTIFATSADATALEWISDNTAPDARFLINATGWFSHIDRGADGGWWIMPLTGRWTSTPPVIYDYGPPAYATRMRELSSSVASFDPEQPAALFDLIEREAITHVYLGADAAPIKPAVFAEHAAFEQVYAQDGVTIFAVQQQAFQEYEEE